jgi:cytochrome c-type biogenesis protein CcmH/NrfG
VSIAVPINRRAEELREMGDELKRAEYAISVRRYDLAIEIMRRVLSQHPENSLAFYTIARAYVFKKMPDKAIEAIRESLRLDPTNSQAHTIYASLLLDKKLPQPAEEEIKAALALDPHNSLAYYVYAIYYLDHRKNVQAAKEYCYRALNLDTNDVRYYWMLGRVFAAEGNVAQAEATYLHALQLEPENARVHNSYGALLYNQIHDAQRAYEHFRLALMQSPNDEEIRKNLLLALKAKNRFYWLFWRYALLRRQLGWRYIFLVLAILMLPWLLAPQIPLLMIPLATLLTLCYVLFVVYALTVNPLFNFLIRHGWLK